MEGRFGAVKCIQTVLSCILGLAEMSNQDAELHCVMWGVVGRKRANAGERCRAMDASRWMKVDGCQSDQITIRMLWAAIPGGSEC